MSNALYFYFLEIVTSSFYYSEISESFCSSGNSACISTPIIKGNIKPLNWNDISPVLNTSIPINKFDQKSKNWKILEDKFPYAKRTHGIKGIHQAHIEAAKNAFTPMVWIVDADAHDA